MLCANCQAQTVFDCVAPTPPAATPVVLGNGQAGSVTSAQLQQAFANGGAIRLHIGSSTLVLDTTLRQRNVFLDLDGATLSGGQRGA